MVLKKRLGFCQANDFQNLSSRRLSIYHTAPLSPVFLGIRICVIWRSSYTTWFFLIRARPKMCLVIFRLGYFLKVFRINNRIYTKNIVFWICIRIFNKNSILKIFRIRIAAQSLFTLFITFRHLLTFCHFISKTVIFFIFNFLLLRDAIRNELCTLFLNILNKSNYYF